MSDALPDPRSWAAPECPDCESDVFVDADGTNGAQAIWTCRLCGTTWRREP
jgi:ribosomal protein L37AE/L43A